MPRPAPSARKFSMLGTGLGFPSEPCSSKVRLIILLPCVLQLHQVSSGLDEKCQSFLIAHFSLSLVFYESPLIFNIFFNVIFVKKDYEKPLV